MVLYTNLTQVKFDNVDAVPKPILKLTSSNITEKVTSQSNTSETKHFYATNGIVDNNIMFIDKLFKEAALNNFEIIIEGV